jgi:hypothetical protein
MASVSPKINRNLAKETRWETAVHPWRVVVRVGAATLTSQRSVKESGVKGAVDHKADRALEMASALRVAVPVNLEGRNRAQMEGKMAPVKADQTRREQRDDNEWWLALTPITMASSMKMRKPKCAPSCNSGELSDKHRAADNLPVREEVGADPMVGSVARPAVHLMAAPAAVRTGVSSGPAAIKISKETHHLSLQQSSSATAAKYLQPMWLIELDLLPGAIMRQVEPIVA